MKMLEHWLPGDDFGAPLACLATTFTFDTDFFAEDCLSRFLSISARDPDGATGLDIAGLLEEEDRLAEARVCVLVDQSCRPEPRNLRWDILPIRVPNALLHAKVAVLLWEHGARVVIGSANLTRAGYRSQVEIATSVDLDAKCPVPRPVLQQLAAELRSIIGLSAGDPVGPGPTSRALEIVGMFEDRLDRLSLPTNAPQGTRVALGVGRLGAAPFAGFDEVWVGSPPQSVVALSPFWDDTDEMPGARAVIDRLAQRAATGSRTSATFVVSTDFAAGSNIVRAPHALRSVAPSRIDAEVVAFKSSDERRLHAKCLRYESATWVATMFGSSNLTAKGLGLSPAPHRELNLWIGCRADSPTAKVLRALVPPGDPIDSDFEWMPNEADEDETTEVPLPDGFREALLLTANTLRLSFNPTRLPASWKVVLVVPGSAPTVVYDATRWDADGRPATVEIEMPPLSGQLPSLLDVTWTAAGESLKAPWMVNVGDGSVLPPPAELKELTTEVLLAILASTRPLRTAIDEALRRSAHHRHGSVDELDPLKRFDSSGFLLQRTRRASAALWGIERRLSQRVHSMEALEWRLSGTLGPEHLAAKLLEETTATNGLPGEAEFLLAELALTVHRVRWPQVADTMPSAGVMGRVRHTLDLIVTRLSELDREAMPAPLAAYVGAVISEVSP